LGLAIGPSGEVYVTEWSGNRVRRIDPAGTITTVIGLGHTLGEGALAKDSFISAPHTVDLGRDGTLYVTEEGLARVRKITPDGVVYTLAGGGDIDASIDNVDPLSSRFATPRIVDVDRDGSLLVADWAGNRIRRIRPALPKFLAADTVIGSAAGDE